MALSREILWLDPGSLHEAPAGVRREQTDDDLDGLAATIREYGVLQPVGVRRIADGYELVYGNRRRRAAIRAGLAAIPCVEVTRAESAHGDGRADGQDGDSLVLQLLENVQRRDLTDMEKAEGFAGLRRTVALANQELRESALDDLVATTLGLSVRTLQRYLRLLELPRSVRTLIAAGKLTVTQAQHLRAVSDPRKQEELARAAVERDLSAAAVRQAGNILLRQPGLDVEEAVTIAVLGGEVANIRPPTQTPAPQRLARPPKSTAQEQNDDANLWPEDTAADDSDGAPERTTGTADGHRVFRIRTVDAFCDDVSRLARALQEGDLVKAVEADDGARAKLQLARRQVDFVARELHALFDRHHWG